MTLFFPDLNVWLALSVESHPHNREAWQWLRPLGKDDRVIFSRFTQIGLLRLLTNRSAMGAEVISVRKAWSVYDRWLEDPLVQFYPEPPGLDACFRESTSPFASDAASKSISDCYLMAYALQCRATLVTFDKALHRLARKSGCAALLPG